MLEEQFENWYAQIKDERFWPWLEETDNATHFKSKENLLFWSERPSKYKEFIKMVWVEYGCPGHGKGPWDGLGAMAKTKVTRDVTDGNVQTPSGRITSPLEVAQHLRAFQQTVEERAHKHENQSSCGHVPRRRRNSPSCCTSRCVTSQRYLVVLLLSVSWHSGALLYAKVQLLV